MQAATRGRVEPTRALADQAEFVLTDDQVGSWRERGFAVVDGVLPAVLLAGAINDAMGVFPAAGSFEAERVNDFGSLGQMAFPASSDAVNALTLHSRMLGAVSQLLGVEVKELRLTQSDLWPKYGRGTRSGADRDNSDQRIHVDYPNHTLTHPPPWGSPEAVEIILYLSDEAGCGGSTAVVPRMGAQDPAYAWPIVNTPGVGALDWVNDRAAAEESLRIHAPAVARFREQHLYPREMLVSYRVGTLLFYRHDTWHRGTPVAPGAMRLAQNLTFRKSSSEWVSVLQPGWAWSMYRRSRVMERLIATVSVEQRCVLGFPAPGHGYWTRDTIAAVDARFAVLGFDAKPYEEALEERSHQ